MSKLTLNEIWFITLFVEGFLYGLYSGLFTLYLQYQASKEDAKRRHNIVSYFLCVLYALSTFTLVCDILKVLYSLLGRSLDFTFHIYVIQGIAFGCCDFLAQFILIYRCWIVWGHNIRVVIIPSILAFAFLATWLLYTLSARILSAHLVTPDWDYPMTLASLALSLAVNALVTGLIVFRIFKVFRGVKTTLDDRVLLGATGGSKLRRTILILIESGMALFAIQLARLVVTIVVKDVAIRSFNIVVGIHDMLNGITPSIIVVRISMGLSFHDDKSMESEGVAIGSLRFASNHPISVPEPGSIGIVGRNDDDIGVQRSNDIEVVER